LKSSHNSILYNEKLLTRFIQQLLVRSDTPSHIQLVASDATYLILCSLIVKDELKDDQKFLRLLTTVCRREGINVHRLREKLKPVARSLGLAVAPEAQTDYYELLGVSPQANESEIRKVFRKKAYNSHPDTSSLGEQGSKDFLALHEAYLTLKDPVLRRQYDQSRRSLGTWYEGLHQSRSHRGNARYFYQLGGLFLVLIIAGFIFDFLFQQSAIMDGSYPTKQEHAPAGRYSATGGKNLDTPNGVVIEGQLEELESKVDDSARTVNDPGEKKQINSELLVMLQTEVGDLKKRQGQIELRNHKVCLFYSKEKDKRIMEKLSKFLQSKGYAETYVQKVKYQDRDIRYFHEEDKDGVLLFRKHVYSFMTSATNTKNLRLRIRNMGHAYPDAPEGLLELWMNGL
jgi:curved DNA-binding protein CbpA